MITKLDYSEYGSEKTPNINRHDKPELIRARQNLMLALSHVILSALLIYGFLLIDSPPVVGFLGILASNHLINPDLAWIQTAKWIFTIAGAIYAALSIILLRASLRDYAATRNMGY